MRRGQAGCLMRADAVMKRCRGAIVVAKRTCKGLREATRTKVRSWRVATEPTFDRQIEQLLRSCLSPADRRYADRGAAREDVDDDHRCSAVSADEDGPRSEDGVIWWRVDLGWGRCQEFCVLSRL